MTLANRLGTGTESHRATKAQSPSFPFPFFVLNHAGPGMIP